jgi:hypothetical protein
LSTVARGADSEEIDIIVVITDASIPDDARAGIDQMKVKMGDKVFKKVVMLNGPKASASIEAPAGKKYVIQDVDKLKLVFVGTTGVKVEGSREKKDGKWVYQLKLYKERKEEEESLAAAAQCPASDDVDTTFAECGAFIGTCLEPAGLSCDF